MHDLSITFQSSERGKRERFESNYKFEFNVNNLLKNNKRLTKPRVNSQN